MDRSQLPIAVIGAGPIGLAAAAHLVARGETPLILEAGDAIGASVREWAHVRFFSPWRYSIDAAARTLLETHGWTEPDPDAHPTGQDLIDHYLAPLAATPEIAPHLRLASRVVSVTRRGVDKMKTVGRADVPFALRVRSAAGREETLLARAVIDASGTWTMPNPLGGSGVPAIGEEALRDSISYGIPDVLGAQRARYAGRRVLVVGSGHSAFNAILDLTRLAAEEPDTTITWAVRRPTLGQVFGGGADDALPERGELGRRVRALVAAGTLRVVTGFTVAEVARTADGSAVVGEGGEALPPVDEIIATTGFRPDLTPLRELRLVLDPAVESPVALAPLIDPNVHSCGTVPPHGAVELTHPETDVYIVGMKSYGRAPTFLLLTGYEQVRSVAAALVGDWEAARAVHLVLPETGVCSSGVADATGVVGAACCGAEADEPATGREPISVTVDSDTAPSARCCAPSDTALLTVGTVDVSRLVTTARPVGPLRRVSPSASSTSTTVAAREAQAHAEDACCTPTEQETCCEPSAKASCCGASPVGSCGCR